MGIVTPNHKILTAKGWKKVSELKKKDCLKGTLKTVNILNIVSGKTTKKAVPVIGKFKKGEKHGNK